MSQLSEIDQRRMDEVTAGVGDNKSEKMRRLAAAGYSRGDIARYLGVRYQFVRNVLVAAEQAAEAAENAQSVGAEGNLSETPPSTSDTAARRSADSAPKWLWTTVGKDGSVRLPPAYLAALGAAEGDEVQLALQRDKVRILSRASALRELQEEVRRYVPEGVSLVDELLAERRTEAGRENGV
jgi:antitoxin component of MazEF toxin-antitoxin module